MREQRNSHTLEILTNLRPFSDEALARLQYLLPENEVTSDGAIVAFKTSSDDEAAKVSTEIRYALYRAKIRAEGERDRAVLFKAIFGP